MVDIYGYINKTVINQLIKNFIVYRWFKGALTSVKCSAALILLTKIIRKNA